MVLAMLFSVPIFSESNYIQEPDPYTVGLKLLEEYPVYSDDFNHVKELLWTNMRELRTPIISLYFRGLDKNGEEQEINMESNTQPDLLRNNEKELVTVGDFDGETFGVAIYDLRKNIVL